MNGRMTRQQLAVIADDINSMAQEFIDTKDVTSLRNMTNNLANMIRIHVIDISDREMKLIVMSMSASQVPFDLQKEVFELVQKLRNIASEAT